MSIFSQEATQELQTMITEIIRKELPLVVAKEIHLNKYEVVKNTVKEVIDELEAIEIACFTELER